MHTIDHMHQGRAQKIEKGGGAHFKVKPAGLDIVMSKKNRSSEEQKKKSSRPQMSNFSPKNK